MKIIYLAIFILFVSCSDRIQYAMTSPNGTKEASDSIKLILQKDGNWELHKDSIYFLGIIKARNVIKVIKQCPEVIWVQSPVNYVFKYSEYLKLQGNKIQFLSATMDTFGFNVMRKFNLYGLEIECSYFDTSNSNIVEWDSICYFKVYSEYPKAMDYSYLLSSNRMNSVTLQLDTFDTELIQRICKLDSTMPIDIVLNQSSYEYFLEAYRKGLALKGCRIFLATRNLKISRKQLKSLRRIINQNDGSLERSDRRYFKPKRIVKYRIYF